MNTMCENCSMLNNCCEGTNDTVYSGCIWKIKNDTVLLPVLEEYFRDYAVPFFLKLVVSNIIRRFTITGSADGMYIANVIAYESGFGDGCGNFKSCNIKNHRKIANRLFNAYRCSIEPEDRKELELMIRTGLIYKETALKGLKTHILSMRKECPLENGGRYTIRYLKTYIHKAADAVDEINGRLPEGYMPSYSVPGYLISEEKFTGGDVK